MHVRLSRCLPSGGELPRVALVAAAYFGAAKAGLVLATLNGNVSPVWPASGLAVAALLFGGPRWWPGIFIGAFAANLFTPAPWWVAAGIACGNTAEGVAGAWVFRRVERRLAWLGKFSEALGFLAMAVLAPVVAALVGVSCLLGAGEAASGQAGALLLTWWAGDAIGALVFAPALLALPTLRGRRPDAGALARFGLFAALASGVGVLIWTGGLGGVQIFLFFPLLLLAAWWFDATGVKLSTAAVVVFTVLVTAMQRHSQGAGALNQSLLILEFYLVAVAVTGLLLATFQRGGRMVLPGLVMVAGWVASGLVYGHLENQRVRLDESRVRHLIEGTERDIVHRLGTYVDALRGGVSLFAASERVSRTEWGVYARALDIVNRHPGINGIGFVVPLRGEEVPEYLAATRADDASDFRIKPVPTGELASADPAGLAHYVITYIEPHETNIQALGLDLASERRRAEAARLARDSGRPTITDSITLVQDGRRGAGFLLYYPVYDAVDAAAPGTVEERREALRGWVYAPFITENFLRALLPEKERQIELRVYAGGRPEPERRVFDSGAWAAPGSEREAIATTRLRLLNQEFCIEWSLGSAFRPGEKVSALVAGSSLALVSALLAWLVLSVQTLGRRASEIAETRTRELRELNARLEGEVTERRRAEEEASRAREAAEAASLAKSAFLTTMSHEIRTPMNSVIG